MTDETGLSLFGAEASPAAGPDAPGLPGAGEAAPLAERMRPASLAEVIGQEHLAGQAGILRKLIDAGHLPSLILHGPPGSGKTTLARAMAGEVEASFVPFSAVSEGVPKLREIVAAARARRPRRTVLFVDEIHRLNKGQQDFLLPSIESGLLTLIGATTEHPGFEVNAALLSRARVLVLEPLGAAELRTVLRRALADPARGLGTSNITLSAPAEELLVAWSGGDARQALNALETAARLAGDGGTITPELAREALQQPQDPYDTTAAYEMLSAFHKSLRASAGSAALYWAMRMIRGGEEPRVLFRRLIAAAYEDVGLADARAGGVATQAMLAYERLGMPEGLLPLANAILYIAHAPKSNRAYLALGQARRAAEEFPHEPVPLQLRNATTSLMKEWGYGKEYEYAHDEPNAISALECLPDPLAGSEFYRPSDRGEEEQIARRMATRAEALRRRAGEDP